MDNLKWYWVYVPYLDSPGRQQESALKAGYTKVCFKYDADAEIRKANRALWITRAMRNKDLRTLSNFLKYVESHAEKIPSMYNYPTRGYPGTYLHNRMLESFETWCRRFRIAEVKCLKKAEEYK